MNKAAPRILPKTGLLYGDVQRIATALNVSKAHVHQVATGKRPCDNEQMGVLLEEYRAKALEATSGASLERDTA